MPEWLPAGWLLLAGLATLGSMAAAGRGALGSCLLTFALGGCLSSYLHTPLVTPGLQAGRAALIRGVVEKTLPGRGERRRLIVRGEARRTLGGWTSLTGRLGVSGPPEARVGDRVEVSGLLEAPLPATNPGGFDARRYWRIHGVSLLLEPHELGYRRLGAVSGLGLATLGQQARDWVQETNRKTLEPRTAAIADSFLIGAQDGGDPEIREDLARTFRDAGTIHLLVVSGTQVSGVLLVFLLVGKRFWRLRMLPWGLGLGALALYHAATGGDASITRAAVFGGLVVLALVLLREVDGENTLGLTLLVLVAVQPAVLFDVGAQLSFAAVWGLVRLAPALEAVKLARGPAIPGTPDPPKPQPAGLRALKLACCANVGAHLTTAPVLAYHFQTSCWAALLSNLIVFPIAGLLLPICVAHLVFSQLGLFFLAPVVTALAHGLYSWSNLFGPPLGAGSVFPPPEWLLPLFFGLVGLTARLALPLRWPATGLLVALLLVSERAPAPPPSAPTLRAIDIGQGDSLLLQGPDGSNILVDSGPPPLRPDRLPLAQALRGLRVPRLDAVVVTHAHADHIGALPLLLQELPVGALVYSPRIRSTPQWQAVLTAAAARRVRTVEAGAGERIAVGGSRLVVLAPDLRAPTFQDDPNEESLVVRWEAAGKRVLLTGDAGFPTEQLLLEHSDELRADVLKVGHHGSSRSTSWELLEQVRPTHALISCGRQNRFGHPHPATLARLQHAGVPVSRTDAGGMVTLRLEKHALIHETFLRYPTGP